MKNEDENETKSYFYPFDKDDKTLADCPPISMKKETVEIFRKIEHELTKSFYISSNLEINEEERIHNLLNYIYGIIRGINVSLLELKNK